MWIKGYEKRYEITREGRVFSHRKNGKTERKLVPDKNGYLTVNLILNGKVYCKKIHREVARTYIREPKEGEQVNHIDGNKQNNNIDNLEWCTNSENYKHMLDNNLKKTGVKYKNNTSGFYGVVKSNGKYTATIKRSKSKYYLGVYDSELEASKVILEELSREAKGLKIRSYVVFKEIRMIDSDGNVVKVFNSIAEAERDTGTPNQSIGKCILGKTKTAGGFKWERTTRKGLV